jgi:RND family efflux transporter MFP subunit
MEAANRSAATAVEQAGQERVLVIERHRASILAAEARIRQAVVHHQQLLSLPRPEQIMLAEQAVAKARAAEEEHSQAYKRARALFEAGVIARANLERAEAAFKAAQADLNSAVAAGELVRGGPSSEEIAVSQAAIDAATADLKRVQSEERAIEVATRAHDVAVARAAQSLAALRRARTVVREQRILAPASGFVTRQSIEVGTIVVPGVPALVVSSRHDLRIEAEISTEDTAKLRPGMEVGITSAAYPGRTFRGKVRGILPVGELKPDVAIRTRIVRARITILQNASLFRPGMEVDVEGKTSLGKRVTIPTDTLRYTGDRATVLTVEDGRIAERPIKVGAQSSGRTEVISGLLVGDEVVVRGKDELKPGMKARAVR